MGYPLKNPRYPFYLPRSIHGEGTPPSQFVFGDCPVLPTVRLRRREWDSKVLGTYVIESCGHYYIKGSDGATWLLDAAL